MTSLCCVAHCFAFISVDLPCVPSVALLLPFHGAASSCPQISHISLTIGPCSTASRGYDIATKAAGTNGALFSSLSRGKKVVNHCPHLDSNYRSCSAESKKRGIVHVRRSCTYVRMYVKTPRFFLLVFMGVFPKAIGRTFGREVHTYIHSYTEQFATILYPLGIQRRKKERSPLLRGTVRGYSLTTL